MERRREFSTKRLRSPDSPRRSRSQSGSTIWLDTMVAIAMEATITMEVAEENPPRKASIAMSPRPSDRGSVSTKRSGFDPGGSRSSPTTAIGTMKRLMAKR